jgi:X-X-X-Leu-X-X-Gly heptad repeat protein
VKGTSNMSSCRRILLTGQLSAVLVLASLAMGCTTGMASDDAGHQMASGIAQVRSGVAKTQSGVTQVNSGSRATGMADVDTGMGMTDRGVSDMHSGMNMMSSGMMMGCMDGGSSAMMSELQQAMDEMKLGQGMLTRDAGSDADGIAHMQNGMTMMTSALGQADGAMHCMGHGNMMMNM